MIIIMWNKTVVFVFELITPYKVTLRSITNQMVAIRLFIKYIINTNSMPRIISI